MDLFVQKFLCLSIDITANVLSFLIVESKCVNLSSFVPLMRLLYGAADHIVTY